MKQIELAALWNRGNGVWFSSVIEADRLSDLFLAANDRPVRLMIRPNEKKTAKSPDAHLIVIGAKT